MPGFDRTGPRGTGPMTGGGRGLCGTRNVGAAYRGYGLGFRGTSPAWPYIGRGRGGLPRCRYPVTLPVSAPYQTSSSEELDFLKKQAGALKCDMEDIERRIRELEKED